MPKKVNKLLLVIKLLIAVLIVTVMNLFLIYWLVAYQIVSSMVYLLVLTVIANLVVLFLLGITLFRPSRSLRSLSSLRTLLDSMPYAIAKETRHQLDSEVTTQTTQNDFDDSIDALPTILKPREVISQNPIIDKITNPNKYLDLLDNYLQANGLIVDKNDIRQFFGYLASTKIGIMQSKHPLISNRFIEVFSEFMGANIFLDEITPGSKTVTNLMESSYHLNSAIDHASKEPNQVVFYLLKEVKFDDDLTYLTHLEEYSMNPNLPLNLEDPHGNHFVLPPNIWIILIPAHKEVLNLEMKTALASTILDMNIKLSNVQDIIKENPFKLSIEHMTNLFSAGLTSHFLEEVEWKKWDKIQDYLTRYSVFKMDNRLFRQLERFSSTVMLFGCEPKIVMDVSLHAKVMYVLKSLTITRDGSSEDTLVSLFEKHFGLENLDKSKTLLKLIKENDIATSEIIEGV